MFNPGDFPLRPRQTPAEKTFFSLRDSPAMIRNVPIGGGAKIVTIPSNYCSFIRSPRFFNLRYGSAASDKCARSYGSLKSLACSCVSITLRVPRPVGLTIHPPYVLPNDWIRFRQFACDGNHLRNLANSCRGIALSAMSRCFFKFLIEPSQKNVSKVPRSAPLP